MSENKKSISKSRIFLFKLIATFIGLVLVLALGEVIFRLNPNWVADPSAPPPHDYRQIDEKYGWLPKGNYQYQGTMHDKCNIEYPVNISFAPNGFRRWGNPTVTNRDKILFIGDSYTACNQTSDDKTFYKLLGDSLPIEVFAIGAAGWGTTQQYLVLEKYIKEINPDLIVWQLCCNDFLDNYWELENASNYHVRMKRPYTLETGEITYHTATDGIRKLKKYSHLLYYMARAMAIKSGRFEAPHKEPAEKLIAEKNLEYPLFVKSINMTNAAMKKMKATVPNGTKLIAFDADGFQPQFDQLKKLCADNQIPYIDAVPNYVTSKDYSGGCTRADDGYHWNNYGNELVSEAIRTYLRNNYTFKSK